MNGMNSPRREQRRFIRDTGARSPSIGRHVATSHAPPGCAAPHLTPRSACNRDPTVRLPAIRTETCGDAATAARDADLVVQEGLYAVGSGSSAILVATSDECTRQQIGQK